MIHLWLSEFPAYTYLCCLNIINPIIIIIMNLLCSYYAFLGHNYFHTHQLFFPVNFFCITQKITSASLT